jgi:hypothetical protein
MLLRTSLGSRASDSRLLPILNSQFQILNSTALFPFYFYLARSASISWRAEKAPL